MKTINHLTHNLVCAVALLVVATTAGAGLLDVQPDYPQVSFGGGSSTAVIDTTQTAAPSFDVNAQSLDLVLTAGGDINTAFGDPVTILRMNVDSVCELITGVVGDDVSVSGTFYSADFSTVVKDGIIFTGEIIEVGNAMATDTTALFDFRATVTGGLLLIDGDWPMDGGLPVNAGIQLTLEGTSIPFTTNNCAERLTSTRAKGIIGPDVSIPPDVDPDPPTNPGTGTLGYWKNHPEAWPVEEITVGGITYTKSDAIDNMTRAVKGDKTISMFRQLVPAMLNVLIDNDDSCIQDTIDAADLWLTVHPLGSGVKAKDDAWGLEGDALHDTLDAYNNGELCAPHRG